MTGIFNNTSLARVAAAIALLSVQLLGASVEARGMCQKIFTRPPGFFNSLADRRASDLRRLTSKELKKANVSEVEALEKTVPLGEGTRAKSLSYDQAWSVLQSIHRHEVVNHETRAIYDAGQTEIGFCFGRAAYVHLTLLKMGLSESAIRKVWALGPMTAGPLTWSFHVATVVYTHDRGWVAIDSNSFKPELLRHWAAKYESRSVDDRLRIYLTEAERFTVDIPSYDRLQMGLSLPRTEDFYSGYFTDLMRSMRTISLNTLGLAKLQRVPLASPLVAAEQKPVTRSFWQRLIGL